MQSERKGKESNFDEQVKLNLNRKCNLTVQIFKLKSYVNAEDMDSRITNHFLYQVWFGFCAKIFISTVFTQKE